MTEKNDLHQQKSQEEQVHVTHLKLIQSDSCFQQWQGEPEESNQPTRAETELGALNQWPNKSQYAPHHCPSVYFCGTYSFAGKCKNERLCWSNLYAH